MKIGLRTLYPLGVCLLMGSVSLIGAKGGPSLGGPEKPYYIQWPEVPEVEKDGVFVVSTTPEDLAILVDGAPVAKDWDGHLVKGQSLEIEQAGGQVLLVWRDIKGGYILHQLLEGPGRVQVGDDGQPQIEGTGWAHLFRAIADALGTYHLTYEEVNTGFESTEVAFVYHKGDPKFLVVEGHVVVGDGADIHLKNGQWSKVASAPGRARRAPKSIRKSAANLGTDVESNLLPDGVLCPADGGGSALLGAALSTQVCFLGVIQRDLVFRVAREAVFVDSSSEFGVGLQEIGNVYLSAGLFGEAAGSYQKALVSDGVERADVARELGNARWAYGNAKGAADAFEIAVEADPQAAGAWMNLGLVSGAVGEEERAMEAFGKAVHLDPSLIEAQGRLGELYLSKGNAKAAVKPLRTALNAAPDAQNGLKQALGRAYRESGQYQRAVKLARKGVKDAPARTEGWYELARSLLAEGKQLEAMRAYEKALSLEMEKVRVP